MCMAALYKKSRKSIPVLVYPLFYLMTMFLGPCVNFRYMYPFIVVLPVLASFVLSERIGTRNDVKREKRTDTK